MLQTEWTLLLDIQKFNFLGNRKMTLAIVLKVIGWILPILLGPIVYIAAKAVLNAHDAIDRLPPIVKRIAVGALGIAVVAITQLLGVNLPAECADAATRECAQAINKPEVLQGITAALVAMLLHYFKKSRV